MRKNCPRTTKAALKSTDRLLVLDVAEVGLACGEGAAAGVGLASGEGSAAVRVSAGALAAERSPTPIQLA